MGEGRKEGMKGRKGVGAGWLSYRAASIRLTALMRKETAVWKTVLVRTASIILTAVCVAGLLAACIAGLAGCGREEEEETMIEGLYFMLSVRTQEYPPLAEDKRGWRSLGQQFYQGEAVRLWWEAKKGEDDIELNIYLSHEDGSTELFAGGLDKEYMRGRMYLGQEGDLYFLGSEELVKLDRDGNVIYRCREKVSDICQLQDGRMALLLRGENGYVAAELDAAQGKVSDARFELEGWNAYIGAGPEGAVLMDAQGFWSLDLMTGDRISLMNFAALSYELNGMVMDFRIQEEGKADVLLADRIENLEKVDVGATRKVVVFRDWVTNSNMKSCAFTFNRENQEYYVVFDECDENTSIVDFRERTGVDIVTGKGADIVTSDALPDVWGYIQKGVLEDLTPYIEKSGMRMEDFFPATFSHWTCDGKIYGVDIVINPTTIWISEELLGGREVPDVETLVADMLAYEGDKKWFWDSSWILHYLLRGSEDMWGLIDREQGTCNFEGGLFADMLRAAKRHGGDFSMEDISANWTDTGYAFFDSEEKLASEGKVYVGFLFDDGAHALANEYGTFAVNSRSRNKEGAWAFISYLLDEERQTAACGLSGLLYGGSFPVNRASFEKARALLLDNEGLTISRGSETVTKEDFMEPERHEGIRNILEQASFAPISNEYILDIIMEEADAYFSGVKSVEEVCGIIQNRVGLYLGENR